MQCPFRAKICDFMLNLLEGSEADEVGEHLLNDVCQECHEEGMKQADFVEAVEAWADQHRRQAT
jgi:cytochrome c5